MTSILLADDSVLIRRIMTSALEAQGWSITAACDGKEALGYALNSSFDLVITDWHMPHLNGDELIKALRDLPAYETTPILVLTAESQESAKQEARYIGANGWLSKPFDPERLVALAATLVSGTSSA